MSIAPEISFPDPAEAIAKTDQAIARSGRLLEQGRCLTVVSGAGTPEELVEPTTKVPAILDELAEVEPENSAALDAVVVSSSVGGALPPATTPVAPVMPMHGTRLDVAASATPGPLAVKGTDAAAEKSRVRLRYRNFIVTGAIVGIVAAAVLIVGLPGDAISGQWVAFGYSAAFFGVVCGGLGGLVAVLTDRKRVQR